MTRDDLGAEPDDEDGVMHAAANFDEWCKRIDGMDRGRKRAYFRSEDPPAPPTEATAAERQGFIDGVIAKVHAIDDAVAGPLDATLDALIAEAPATADADHHTTAESSGL